MELKRLIAEDSKSALQRVRTTYGEDALIVSTNKIGSKTEVICAVDLMPDNEPFIEDDEANPTVNPAQSGADDAAPCAPLLRLMQPSHPPGVLCAATRPCASFCRALARKFKVLSPYSQARRAGRSRWTAEPICTAARVRSPSSLRLAQILSCVRLRRGREARNDTAP